MALINYIFNHKNGSNKFHLCLKSSKNNIIVPRGKKKKPCSFEGKCSLKEHLSLQCQRV